MEINTREVNDITVVDIIGELDTNTAPDAENNLKKIIDDGKKFILVNFEKLEYISSAGLRILLVTAKKLSGIGGELRICNLNETVEEIFSISGFIGIFNVYDNEEEALK